MIPEGTEVCGLVPGSPHRILFGIWMATCSRAQSALPVDIANCARALTASMSLAAAPVFCNESWRSMSSGSSMRSSRKKHERRCITRMYGRLSFAVRPCACNGITHKYLSGCYERTQVEQNIRLQQPNNSMPHQQVQVKQRYMSHVALLLVSCNMTPAAGG